MGTWSFTYDTLNRLVSALPALGNTVNGGQNLCWSYDAFGNRTAQSSQSAACPALPSVPTPTASYNANNQITWTSVNAAGSNFTYDATGDVTNDNSNQYLYDAEGRICAVRNLTVGVMTGYLYDADGTRIAKGTITNMTSCDPALNGFQTSNDYVLGLGGEQVSEMGVGDATSGSSSGTALAWQHTNVFAGGKLLGTYDKDGLHFYFDDPLGTRRAQTDYEGVLEQTCVSLPYGDGLSCSGGDLTAPTEHHFTGKERDSESGNDYFGARYYSSAMGRFMSPDWSAKYEPIPYAKLDNPQTLNLYAYVGNSPLNKVDPDGHDFWDKVGNLLNHKGWTDTPRPPLAPVTTTVGTPKWHYQQSTGNVSLEVKVTSSNGKSGQMTESTPAGGYAGRGTGLNNPDAQGVSQKQDEKNAGPVPRGDYTIGSARTNEHGPVTMPLTPSPQNNMEGDRGGFLIHADNPSKPAFNSSEGCPVLPRATRVEISGSGVNQLQVDR